MIIPQALTQYMDSQLNTIEEVGLPSYLMDKLQERNPFQSSPSYQKKIRSLKTRITYLTAMKRRSYRVNGMNQVLQTKVNSLKNRIKKLKIEYRYVEEQEKAQTILKWATPCNLLIPGSGDSLRMTAYSIKIFSALHYHYDQFDHLDELKRVIREISLAGTLSVISSYVYDKIRPLKNYLTYTSFRSFIHSSFDV